MIQGAIAAAMEEVIGGIVKSFPGPSISAKVEVSITLTVKEGKVELKEGGNIDIDLKLQVGGAESGGDEGGGAPWDG